MERVRLRNKENSLWLGLTRVINKIKIGDYISFNDLITEIEQESLIYTDSGPINNNTIKTYLIVLIQSNILEKWKIDDHYKRYHDVCDYNINDSLHYIILQHYDESLKYKHFKLLAKSYKENSWMKWFINPKLKLNIGSIDA